MSYPETINGIYLRQLDLAPDRIAYYFKRDGRWIPRTLREVHELSEKVGMGLRALGVSSGTTVGILAQTSPEWTLADAAILSLGAITVGIYPSSMPDQVAYLLEHAEVPVLILEDRRQLEKVLAHLDQLSHLKVVIQIDGAPGPLPGRLQGMRWQDLLELGAERAHQEPGLFRKLALEVQPDEVATYIYTSGTTGHPKGAILTHGNFYRVIQAVKSSLELRPDEVSLIFLPLAHSLQRFTCYQGMEIGGTGYFAESLEKVQENFQEVRPTILAAVPRILEKIYTRVHSTVNSGPPIRRKLFDWAMAAGREYHRHPAGRAPLPARLKYRLADRLVFSRIKTRLGGRVTRMISGGAPLSPAISEFFHAMGILVIEGYGLTETCAPATANTPSAWRFGTVGRALPGVDLRIADDGEVLIRSVGLFQGYYKDPEATQEAIRDGWFHSGDIGTLDEDGFLRITDRKKDLIITSAGKNIAPQEIENRLKGHPLISNAMLHGDKRNFLSALITLDEEEVRVFLGDTTSALETLSRHPKLEAGIKGAVDALNATLASYETIKRYAILPVDFTVEAGDLTPTLKLKRRVVAEKYRSILDGFYQENFR